MSLKNNYMKPLNYIMQIKLLNSSVFFNMYLFSFLYLDARSNRLFIDLLLSLKLRNRRFSSKQRLHDFVTGLQALDFRVMDHLIWYSMYLYLSSQTYLESSVSFSFWRCQRDFLWLLNLVSNSVSLISR